MHSCCFYTHSYRHWVTDNDINQTGQRIIELKNSENTPVVVLQVKKAHKEKPSYWQNHEKWEAEEAWCSVQTDL